MTREDLRRAGERTREQLGLGTSTPGTLGSEAAAPGFAQMMSEAVYGGVWSRPGLALDERMICTLAVAGLRAPPAQLGALVAAALNVGLAPRSILEVFVHCGLYGGFGSTEAACAKAREVFAARGVSVPDEPARTDSLEALQQAGQRVMHTLHGVRAGAGYAAPGNAVTGGLYAVAIRYGYGELWSRPGLDHRQRLLCALAAFTALGLETQFVKFAQAAIDNGFSLEQVIEAVIQTAPYGGFPFALNALGAIAKAMERPPHDGP